LWPEGVGADGMSSPSSLKGSRGAREAASIIWRSRPRVRSSARIVQRHPSPWPAMPHRTTSATVLETALNCERCHTSDPSGPLTPRNGTRRLKSTTERPRGPFMDRSLAGWQAARPLAHQPRKGSSLA
jgi:hypothetical protein